MNGRRSKREAKIFGSFAKREPLQPFALAPRQRGEGKGEGPVFIGGPLSRRAFGSAASPPFGGEAKIFVDLQLRGWCR